jgi:tRNA nucleotidyltransferase (CCA-adding enzyme)
LVKEQNNKGKRKMKELVSLIKEIGGKCYLTGGAVIDKLSGKPIKDWDIEVFGVSLDKIQEALEPNGFHIDLVGKSFGVIKTKAFVDEQLVEVDLSVPRRENKIGKGHKEFFVECDPNMTIEEAARRRDLTINSIYMCMETEQVVDPFNGLADLKDGCIKATDSQTFKEDPLRVLRIAQLLPRKGNYVDDSTITLCQEMVDCFVDLPGERVFEEFKKLLLKADKPSMGLEFLKQCGWIKHFPELDNLIGCKQSEKHHPEGDVWTHTKLVVDRAAELKDNIEEDWRLAFMFGAMLHDVGKPSTTDPVKLTAYGHDSVGFKIAETFMSRITNDKTLINRVCLFVKNHMKVWIYQKTGAKLSTWKKLHNELRLDMCAWISLADHTSFKGKGEPYPPFEMAQEYFRTFGPDKIAPCLQGRHLIEVGMKPGPKIGERLAKAYKIQIEEDVSDIRVLLKRVLR